MYSRLKICGITNLDDALITLEIGAHWLGFNFYPESPRYIDPGEASKIIEEIMGLVHCVGILVRPTFEQAEDVIRKSQVDGVQIYEPQGFNDLSKLSVPAIIAYQFDPDRKEPYDLMGAEMILLDSKSDNALGGTGKTFDWSMIPKDIPRDKLILAGGINPDNIGEALRKVKPAVIDVASGSESAPGKKDYQKIKYLFAELNQFNYEESKKSD
jgi:phosphoribosylanthranilate isomerase